jgi:formimidoylglutamate deiminase
LKRYWFKQAYLDCGWVAGVTVTVSEAGLIDSVIGETAPEEAQVINFAAIPGVPNSHSHAFQRAMAGLSEKISATHDTFWSWRKIMYDFAHRIAPEDQRAIAAQLYVEMLKAGYTSVAEFHYLHHQPSGQPYAEPAALSLAIMDAAQQAQINLTLLPVLYMSSDFGGAPLKPEQQMFANTTEQYRQLMSTLAGRCDQLSEVTLGAAFHSLRAVPADAMAETLGFLDSLDQSMPIHIHIAEQIAEVEASLGWSGLRPVEWLFRQHTIDRRWCLVHATHLSSEELSLIAASGATVSLCPTTEANLGDGFFPLREFLQEGGSIAIGSDSNTSVSPVEELRLLEYGQRLVHQARNIAASPEIPQTGTRLLNAVWNSGEKVMGVPVGKIAAGYLADIVILDTDAADFAGKTASDILNTVVFCGNSNRIRDVMCRGQWVVKNFSHVNEGAISTAYLHAISRLQAAAN